MQTLRLKQLAVARVEQPVIGQRCPCQFIDRRISHHTSQFAEGPNHHHRIMMRQSSGGCAKESCRAEIKFGSLCNPSAEIRERAVAHMLESGPIVCKLGSRDVSLWLPDGSNYPARRVSAGASGWLEEALGRTHAALGPTQRLLVE